MKPQTLFLAVAILSIILSICFFFTQTGILHLPEAVSSALSYANSISYLVLLYSIIWIVQKVNKNKNIIVAVTVLIALNVVSSLLSFLAAGTINLSFLVSLPLFCTTIYFIYQCMVVKTSFYTLEFKFIGAAFLVRMLAKFTFPLLFSYDSSFWAANILFGNLATLAILFLIIKSFKIEQTETEPKPYLD